jgi:hypothetical protein
VQQGEFFYPMENKELPELISSFLNTNGIDSEELKKKIYQSVLELLIHNTSALYQVLYRIDVKEEKVKNAFIDNPLAELAAERITTLIIERQIEKIQWRKKYKF